MVMGAVGFATKRKAKTTTFGTTPKPRFDAKSAVNSDAMDVAKKHMARAKTEDEEDHDEEDDFDIEGGGGGGNGAPAGIGDALFKTSRKPTRMARAKTKIMPVITNTTNDGKEEVKIDEADLMAMGVPTYERERSERKKGAPAPSEGAPLLRRRMCYCSVRGRSPLPPPKVLLLRPRGAPRFRHRTSSSLLCPRFAHPL
jgi:hypothetical protein